MEMLVVIPGISSLVLLQKFLQGPPRMKHSSLVRSSAECKQPETNPLLPFGTLFPFHNFPHNKSRRLHFHSCPSIGQALNFASGTFLEFHHETIPGRGTIEISQKQFSSCSLPGENLHACKTPRKISDMKRQLSETHLVVETARMNESPCMDMGIRALPVCIYACTAGKGEIEE